MRNFIKALSDSAALVADGATGTQLQTMGLKPGASPEAWNVDNPQAILSLHRGYIEAGAAVILTNTFGGTRHRLSRHGLDGRVREINAAAARLARQAAGESVFVFGDIGPTGELLKPLGKVTVEEAAASFAEQTEGLLGEGRVDTILIETMSDINEAKAAFEGVHRVSADIPVIVTFSFDSHGRTMMGLKPEKAAREMWALGVTAVGANCGRTLTETLAAIEQMRAAVPEAVLMAKPNAGLPHASQGNVVYDVTPDVMGEYALQFAAQGVKIFGGCCGSTPEHITAIARALA